MKFEKAVDDSVNLYRDDGTFYMNVLPTATVSTDGNYIVITGGGITGSVRERYTQCYNIAGVSLGVTATAVAQILQSAYFYASTVDLLDKLNDIETKVDTIDTVVDATLVDTTAIEIDTDFMQRCEAGLQYFYPSNALGVSVPTAAPAYTLGAITEIIPAGTIATDFILTEVMLDAVSAAANYMLYIYYGAADTYYGMTKYRTAMFGKLELNHVVIPGGSRVRVQLATSSPAIPTNNISLGYRLV